MGNGVCNAFDKIAARSTYIISGDTAGLRRCGMTIPQHDSNYEQVQGLDLSPPSGFNVIMRGGGFGAYPTRDVKDCVAQGVHETAFKDVAPGQSRTEGFKCLDARTEEVLLDFSAIKACEAGKDPAKAGSCTTTPVDRNGNTMKLR